MKAVRGLLMLFSLVGLSVQHPLSRRTDMRSTPEDDSYIAGVVEYEVINNTTLNLQNYVRFIQDASQQAVDILVFPELTLTSNISVVIPTNSKLREFPVPALRPDLYDEVLVKISEAARQYEIYVVVNIEEFVNCTENVDNEQCPEPTDILLFNSNVVFDRNGAIINKYRKINLFGEPTRTSALTPDLGVFETDFGVTFAHFISFDMAYQVPAVQVIQKHNITDVVYSTKWYSELPYSIATEVQQAYAQSMNVNFLAAGANSVSVGSAGSGIYSGSAGSLISMMPGQPTTRLLVAKVPKVPGMVNPNDIYPGRISNDIATDNLFLITDSSLPSHVTRLLRDGLQEFELRHNDVICHFRVNLRHRVGATNYRYRAAAFDGVRDVNNITTFGTKICSVIACTGESIETCGKRFDNYISDAIGIFEELRIVATLPTPRRNDLTKADNSAYFPMTLNTEILPLRIDDYTFQHSSMLNLISKYEISLTNTNIQLYSFAVWGRDYITDGQVQSPPSDQHEDAEAITIPTVPDLAINFKMRTNPTTTTESTATTESTVTTESTATTDTTLNTDSTTPSVSITTTDSTATTDPTLTDTTTPETTTPQPGSSASHTISIALFIGSTMIYLA